MRVKLDDRHFLKSDEFCYWITVLAKNPKDPGNPSDRRVSGYCNSMEDAVASYADKNVKSSDAETVEQLAKDVSTLKKQIMNWKKVLDKITEEN